LPMWVNIFLTAVTIQRGRERTWMTVDLHNNTMKCDRYLHVLCFLHFPDSNETSHKVHKNCDRLWEQSSFSTLLNCTTFLNIWQWMK
jgi:hypothetical protein